MVKLEPNLLKNVNPLTELNVYIKMVPMNRIAAKGRWGTVEWAMNAAGGSPAHDYFKGLEDGDKAKLNALFGRLAEDGKILNHEKFRKLGQQGGKKYSHLWEFKSFQLRFLGDFRGNRFIVAHGTRKKKDELPDGDKSTTVRILAENDAFEAKAKKG